MLRAMVHGSDVLDFATACAREWLLTDGIGGWAAGTASGAPMRRLHALLAAASPQGRSTPLVLRFEEKLQLGATAHELSATHLAGRPAREGAFAHLESFTSEPWPQWRWRIEDTALERTLRLLPGHTAMLASWRLLQGGPARLNVAPLLLVRPGGGEPRGAVQGIPGRVRLETTGAAPGVTLWHNGAFLPARGWVKGLATPLEDPAAEAGEALLPGRAEDVFLPGWVQATLTVANPVLHVVLSPEEGLFRALATEERLGTPPARTLNDCLAALDRGALERRQRWTRGALTGADFTARQAAASHGGEREALARRSEPLVGEDDEIARRLSQQLYGGLVRRQGRLTLVGAWPGGEERGAETLRAAAALVSVRAFEPARQIARGYLEYLDEGLAPESFQLDDGLPRYGDPEPSLWLVNLVDLLARRATRAPGQDEFLRETAWPALEGVLHHLRSGSRHGVHCDSDGLLWAGEGAAARAGSGTNALWYHALVAMAQLGKLLGRRENAAFYLAWAHDLQRRYSTTFWDDDAGCLFEAVTAAGRVRGLSPSQLWAVALPPALLPAPLAEKLLRTVDRELLLPTGLRERPDDGEDSAAWLGAWGLATLRAHGRSPDAIARVAAKLAAATACAGAPVHGSRQVSALAAAELLRAWIEDDVRVLGEAHAPA